ncbi:acyltransferase [Streptomyces fradiae]
MAALDGLRLLAALMVVFHHYVGYGGGTKPSDSAWGRPASEVFHRAAGAGAYAWAGICLFFIISGFVICMSSWGRGLGAFFRSRVMRLYPAYWFAVLATTAVLVLWPVVREPMGVHHVLANLTMVHLGLGISSVDAVYWTLWIELRFYLLFALVVWKGVTYRKVVAFCLLWTVAGLLKLPMLDTLVMSDYSSFFVAGLALYLMHRYGPNLLLWGIVAFSWILSVQYAVEHQAQINPALGRTHVPDLNIGGSHLHEWPGVLLITLSYLVMIAVALGWTARIRWRWLTVAGALTYPLYLLHEVIGWTFLRLLHRHGVQPWVAVAAVTAGMLGAAWLVHRLIERPLAPLLRRGLDRAVDQLRAAEPPAARLPLADLPAAEPATVPRPPVRESSTV